MDVNLITQNLKQFPAKAIGGLNTIGEHATNFCKEKQDAFISSKAGEFCKGKGINKNTIIGAGLILSASVLALKCLKSLEHKIKETVKD